MTTRQDAAFAHYQRYGREPHLTPAAFARALSGPAARKTPESREQESWEQPESWGRPPDPIDEYVVDGLELVVPLPLNPNYKTAGRPPSPVRHYVDDFMQGRIR